MRTLEKPSISDCGRFHLGPELEPLYEARFDQVLAFHKVGDRFLAPVQNASEAYHIDTSGRPIYKQRFQRCFGYYNNLAAVISEEGWHHIDQMGNPLYPDRYLFAGNYQESLCVVMDAAGNYFHLDSEGDPAYESRWRYCGDFRDGIAVVQADTGLSTHIRVDGALLHNTWFLDLDVYHKSYARAKTDHGWCHIDKHGSAIYPERYASVEPFYNGFARCEAHDGAIIVIDESGCVARHLRGPTTDKFSEVSADMVGYWKTYTIYTAVKLGVFEQLPATIAQLSETCSCDLQRIERLLRALGELDLVIQKGDHFSVTDKGAYLCASHQETLADAAIEYGDDLLQRWHALPTLIQGSPCNSAIFSEVAVDPQRVVAHHRMLASYALHDYTAVVPLFPIQKGQKVLDAAGGTGTLATLLQSCFSDSSIYLGDLASVVEKSPFPNKLTLDLFRKWPGCYDIVVLARVLHDWADDDAIRILQNAKQALTASGEIYLLEMLINEKSHAGALCDLHLLAVTGGQERTTSGFERVAMRAGLQIKKVVDLPSLVSLIVLEKREQND